MFKGNVCDFVGLWVTKTDKTRFFGKSTEHFTEELVAKCRLKIK